MKRAKHISLGAFVCAILFLCLAGCGDVSSFLDSLHIGQDSDHSEYYDYVLDSGEGYNIVAKQSESVDYVWEEVGVIDDDDNWIIPLSKDTPINPLGKLRRGNLYAGILGHWKNGQYVEMGEFEHKCKSLSMNLCYVGEGIFLWSPDVSSGTHNEYNGTFYTDAQLWNIMEDSWYEIGDIAEGIGSSTTHFYNEYMVVAEWDGWDPYIELIDTSGAIIHTGLLCKNLYYMGRYAEGVFFCYDGFYDINGRQVIDLANYAGRIENHPYFDNGESELIVENSNGTEYRAVIDADGNYISEFTEY